MNKTPRFDYAVAVGSLNVMPKHTGLPYLDRSVEIAGNKKPERGLNLIYN